jgi:hypothetical protein
MRAIVDDPRQNQHRWIGTLKVKEEPDTLHLFIKTSRDAHFVSQGTVVETGDMISDPVRALRMIFDSAKSFTRDEVNTVVTHFEDDLRKVNEESKNIKFYVIERIEYNLTTPLTQMLNIVTAGCFNSEYWLKNAGKIGQESIKLGRRLPPLPV